MAPRAASAWRAADAATAESGGPRKNRVVTVVGFEAWCDYVTEDEYRDELARSSLPAHAVDEALMHFRKGASVRVQEFAALADGRRLALGDERGFSAKRLRARVPGRTHEGRLPEP